MTKLYNDQKNASSGLLGQCTMYHHHHHHHDILQSAVAEVCVCVWLENLV